MKTRTLLMLATIGFLALVAAAIRSNSEVRSADAALSEVTGGIKRNPGRNTEPTEKNAEELFKTKLSPGAIAVGVAEGNMTVTGAATKLYNRHIDPGNGVINRGFCSWNKSKNITVAEADRRCLARLKIQAADTEENLHNLGIKDVEALLNGTDLSNQSPRAGADFPRRYKEALDRGLTGYEALQYARVEAFRKPNEVLSASGLFRICRRHKYYRRRLQGKKQGSGAWRWHCIALDQGRRIRAIRSAIAHHKLR